MRLYRFILLLFGLLIARASCAQGLKFQGNECAIDMRTSYNVFCDKPPVFSENFDIRFDMALYPTTHIGYIFRIKNAKSNKIYNLFYDGQGGDLLFRLNEEGRSSLITARLDRSELPETHWFKMRVAFDLKGDSIRLSIHNKNFVAAAVELPDEYHSILIFGKSDHIIDVPSFAIRNLVVSCGKKEFSFPLCESCGEVIYNAHGKAMGTVVNPEWLINDAYHWRFKTQFASQTVAGANYNIQRKEIYFFNRDTLSIYNMKSEQTFVRPFAEQCPVPLKLGMNFIDTNHNRLYAYEVYSDEFPPPATTIASLDLDSDRWMPVCSAQLEQQMHHHGAYFNPELEQYTIYGGFGNMHYGKDFHVFDLRSSEWQTLDGFSGDPLFPRYFSSVGYLPKNNSIYVFGGMGNESGEQVVGRYYFYDLHRVDLTTKQISKLWEIPWEKENVVPVRGMVILDDTEFYTLCYPESRSDSFLRLYRFSIEDGSYEILGDSIPIHSDKITTNANLYYDEQQNDLYATVQEFDDDIVSQMKVYALAFPPITADNLTDWPPSRDRSYMIFGLLLVLAGGGYIAYRRIRFRRDDVRRGAWASDELNQGSGNLTRPNSISLFGDFMVRDRNNRDVTYMFSVRLKQTFCLILQDSLEEGISSQRLSSLLWPDKPENKVKNSRGVTINHLRKTLSELDGVELIYNKGCFKIVQHMPFYCDYTRCLEIISDGDVGENRDELIRILRRGKLLKSSDQPLFDSFKEKLERRLEPVLQVEMEKCFLAEDYRMTMKLAELVFDIDLLNDDALAFLIRSLLRLKQPEEARIRYQTFAAEYKKTFGREYPQPFKSF